MKLRNERRWGRAVFAACLAVTFWIGAVQADPNGCHCCDATTNACSNKPCDAENPNCPGNYDGDCATPWACCFLPFGNCRNLDPDCCVLAGGTPTASQVACSGVQCPTPEISRDDPGSELTCPADGSGEAETSGTTVGLLGGILMTLLLLPAFPLFRYR